MKPLYYAIMKYMTTVKEASNMDVIHALKKDYGSFKMLRPDAVQEALMTAKANGLLDESRRFPYRVTRFTTRRHV